MHKDLLDRYNKIKNSENQFLAADFDIENASNYRHHQLKNQLDLNLNVADLNLQKRLISEIEGFGPIQELLLDDEITEILINNHQHIFYEKNGQIKPHKDAFCDQKSYHHFIEKIGQLCKTYINSEKPFIECQNADVRYTVIYPELAKDDYLVSLRKQPKNIWTLNQLHQKNWCSESQLKQIQKIIDQRKNFIVIGGTGSGKTSVLQSVIAALPENQRLVILEDTQELKTVHPVNCQMLTRQNSQEPSMNIDLHDLVKKSLRLRPDRLCVGEIRGPEATALLMALATGHEGSFSSLHARNAFEALIRLEMLVQMGAPQWSIESIRKLIQLTVQNIIVVHKTTEGRRLEGLYEITSVESHGFTVMSLC